MTDTAQGSSLARAHQRLDAHDARIRELELSDAGAQQWRSETTKKLNDIEGTLKWVARLFLGALALAVVSFIVNGGLNGAQ